MTHQIPNFEREDGAHPSPTAQSKRQERPVSRSVGTGKGFEDGVDFHIG